MNTTQPIQELLDIYAERKTGQNGVIAYSSLRLVYSTAVRQTIEINGHNDGSPFSDDELSKLASILFQSFQLTRQGNVFSISASPAEITEHLIGRIDQVALYPETDHLNIILEKLGRASPLAPDQTPAILPYPFKGMPLNQFELCEGRGFFIHSRKFLDLTLPESGLIVDLPYNPYCSGSLRDANVAVLALESMGLRLPFPDYVFTTIRRELTSRAGTRYFPDRVIPTDGIAGSNVLAGYGSAFSRNNLRFVIMEEPESVAAALAHFAGQLKRKPGLRKTFLLTPEA